MAVDQQEAVRILGRLLSELRARQTEVQRLEDYYHGRVGKLKYASKEFAEFFADRYKQFSDNWTQVVADAPTERLEVTGFRLGTTDGGRGEVDKDLWRVWRHNDADYFSDQAFLDAIIAKRAYVLVWGNSEDESTPVITWEHPSQAIVAYDSETRKRRAAAKWWVDEWGDREFATLYLPDQLWKFQRKRVTDDTSLVVVDERGREVTKIPVDERGWEPRQPDTDDTWPIDNPLGEVPLVELVNRPRLVGEPLSDVAGVVAMQDAINLFWAYLFNAADFASFPQRVILNAERPKTPILDENGQVIGHQDVELEKFAVNRVVWLEDPQAKIGEWSAANLQLYSAVIEDCVSHVAAQSRTPPHYLMSKIVNANAETLKTAETGLVKRTEEKTKSFGRGLRDVAALVALAQNDRARYEGMLSGQTLWRDVEIRSEGQAIDAAQKLWSMGYPLEYISRRIGLDPEEIDEVLEMKRREIEIDPVGALNRRIDAAAAVGQLPPPEPNEG